MNRVVFLLEEASMRDLLNGLLPRLYPDLTFLCLAHEGKSDLERSIPRKLRACALSSSKIMMATIAYVSNSASCNFVGQQVGRTQWSG